MVIYLSVDRHLEYFHFETAIKMLLYLCRCSCVDICFYSLGYPSRGEIAESCGNSMFKLLRNCQVIFQNRCIILYSHQQCMKVPISPHPCQHVIISLFFLNCSLPRACKEISPWFWFYIFLMAVEHLFMCFFAHLNIFFEEMCIQIFCPLENWVVSLLLSFKSCLYILDTSTL